MGWFSRRRRGRDTRPISDVTVTHLTEFLRTHHGVEAYVETPTSFNDASVVLVAHDGEWTRRTVPSVRWAHTFADHHQIPGYDAAVVGYPQRMRDWNARRRAVERRRQREN